MIAASSLRTIFSHMSTNMAPVRSVANFPTMINGCLSSHFSTDSTLA